MAILSKIVLKAIQKNWACILVIKAVDYHISTSQLGFTKQSQLFYSDLYYISTRFIDDAPSCTVLWGIRTSTLLIKLL